MVGRDRPAHRCHDLTTLPHTAQPEDLEVEEPAPAGSSPTPTLRASSRSTGITDDESSPVDQGYFVERKLYPNVDFYSGVILRAIGLPLDMFTVMFALGRMPGWIANWKEIHDDTKGRIYRPRQIYVGPTDVEWKPREER